MSSNSETNQEGGKRNPRRRSASPKPTKRAASPKRKAVRKTKKGGECGCNKQGGDDQKDDKDQNQDGGKKRKTVAKKGAKRPPNKWILALKEFNKGKKNWEVPKKGSASYAEVRKIMAKL